KKDSLLQKLSTAKEDTAKAMLLLTLASWYETSNQDSAAYFLEKGKALSEKLKFLKGLYHYQNQKTILLYTKGDYKPAMKEAEKGLTIARQMKDTSNVIVMLNNLGILSMYFGDYEGQLSYAMQVVKSTEAIKDSSMLAGAYHNLANSYHALKQYRKGVTNAAYGIYVNNISSKKYGYINRVYATLAQCYEGLAIMDSALHFYNIAIKEAEQANDKYAEASIYGYKSNVHALLNQFPAMLASSKKSVQISSVLQSRQLTAGALNTLAFAQYLNNNNKDAKENIRQALMIAREDSLIEELKEAYTFLSYIAARDGDFAVSIKARKGADSIADVILNDKVIKNTADLEQKYESAKKDARIQMQQAQLFRKSTWNYLLIGTVATILIISLLSYRNYRNRQKIQQQRIHELETEKQLAATEAVLTGEEQERTRLAKDLHDGLGGMLSGIKYTLNNMRGNLIMTPENAQAFARSIDMLDSSIREMRRVAHNLMPEALVKFGLDTALQDFCNDINQSGALKVAYQSIGMDTVQLDQTKSVTIYRIVQELLNNIMKHAAAKTALVQLSHSNDQLTLTVEDDGKGFDSAILQQSKGIGWSNIQNRIEFLKGKWDVASQPGKGTSVHIEIAS
ncbi:MAG TPA: sensor histidine kinase, partial [Flavisolibacter sp.]|nr:sensor histidine kinase [Flavisolibacter sp.]